MKPADYQRRWRQRRAQGLAVVQITLPLFQIVEALIEAGRLTPAQALDRGAVQAALRELEDFSTRWLK